MEATWDRIDTWLKARVPKLFNSLQPGATEIKIQETENHLGVEFPEDVRASYLIHDGQDPDAPYGIIPGGWNLLALDEIIVEWEAWKELLDSGEFEKAKGTPSGPVRDDWWNLKWIPLTHDGSGNHHGLDLDPPPKGRMGQIISMGHDGDERKVLTPSWQDFLDRLARDLERGKHRMTAHGWQ